MEVLKKGRPQAGWSTESKCTGFGNGNGGCEAELLVSEYDIYRRTTGGGSETEYHATFCCPLCGVETDLDIHKVPRMNGKEPTEEERKAIGLKNRQDTPADKK